MWSVDGQVANKTRSPSMLARRLGIRRRGDAEFISVEEATLRFLGLLWVAEASAASSRVPLHQVAR